MDCYISNQSSWQNEFENHNNINIDIESNMAENTDATTP